MVVVLTVVLGVWVFNMDVSSLVSATISCAVVRDDVLINGMSGPTASGSAISSLGAGTGGDVLVCTVVPSTTAGTTSSGDFRIVVTAGSSAAASERCTGKGSGGGVRVGVDNNLSAAEATGLVAAATVAEMGLAADVAAVDMGLAAVATASVVLAVVAAAVVLATEAAAEVVATAFKAIALSPVGIGAAIFFGGVGCGGGDVSGRLFVTKVGETGGETVCSEDCDLVMGGGGTGRVGSGGEGEVVEAELTRGRDTGGEEGVAVEDAK